MLILNGLSSNIFLIILFGGGGREGDALIYYFISVRINECKYIYITIVFFLLLNIKYSIIIILIIM